MRVGVVTCPAETPILEAVKLLLQQNADSMVVVDNNHQAIGIFGSHQIGELYARSSDLSTLTVAEGMSTEIPQVPPDIPVLAAVQLMVDQHWPEIYLMHPASSSAPNRPVGSFSFKELLREVAGSDE